jgi:hypothetical protein
MGQHSGERNATDRYKPIWARSPKHGGRRTGKIHYSVLGADNATATQPNCLIVSSSCFQVLNGIGWECFDLTPSFPTRFRSLALLDACCPILNDCPDHKGHAVSVLSVGDIQSSSAALDFAQKERKVHVHDTAQNKICLGKSIFREHSSLEPRTLGVLICKGRQ